MSDLAQAETARLQAALAKMKQWTTEYIRSHDDPRDDVQKMLSLKEEHTDIVRRICVDMAHYLRLSPADAILAEIMGLLHDIGRFPQYAKYRTFVDAQSVDHATIGLETIETHHVLDALTAEERQLVIFAIDQHNKRAIAETDNKRAAFFARLLRDADKLDIYRVLAPMLSPSDGAGVSPDFLARFVRGEQVNYTSLLTWDDRKLVGLTWIYDVNFAWTLRRIVARGYIEGIIRNLPHGQEIERGYARLYAYSKEKCTADDVNLAGEAINATMDAEVSADKDWLHGVLEKSVLAAHIDCDKTP